jgi:TRAP transporter TAXI family solute receptor
LDEALSLLCKYEAIGGKKMKMQAKQITLSVFLVTIFLLALLSNAKAEKAVEWPRHISLSSASGSQWVVAVGLTSQIQKYTKVSCAALGPTGGTEANLRNLQAKQAELALNSNPAIVEAWKGTGPFKKEGPQKWLRTISRCWVTNYHVIANSKSGIKGFEDIKGKRWGDLYVGSSMTVTLLDGLRKIYHLDPGKDYKSLPASKYAEFVAMLKEGRADVVSFFGGIPSPQAVDLTSSMDVTLIPLTKEGEALLPEAAPGYTPGIIPAKSYKGQDKDVAVAQALMTLMTRVDIPDEVIYGICKALFDHPDELDPIHPNFKQFSRNPASVLVTVPYHPGAIKYYKEKGLWTAELEARQKKLMAN